MARASAPRPFGGVPPEIRCLIWEASWPQPRAFKLSHRSGTDSSFVYLQFLCSLEAWCGHSNSPGCPQKDVTKVPVALHVCQESREHTLRTLALLSHKSTEYAYYINPKVDILQIGPTTGTPRAPNNHHHRHEFTESLRDGYGKQLEFTIKSVAMTSDYLQEEDARGQLCCFRSATRIQVISKENAGTRQANDIAKQIQVMKGMVERYFELFDPKNPPPSRPKYRVVGESCIIKDYPDERVISVNFMDEESKVLDLVKVCRDQYWWSVNHGGGGFFAGPYNVGSNEDENEDEDDN